MRIASALLVSGLLAAPAATQTQVFMISHKDGAKAGNTNNNIPYSWYPTRYQQVYDAGSFDVGTPTALSQLYYRMNSSFANGSYGGQTVELAVWMAHAASGVDSQTCTGTFANNPDNTTLKQVIKKVKVLMPKLANTSWGIKLPFDSGVTFLYGAVLKKDLVIETRVYGNSNSNGIFTYPLDALSVGAGSYVQNGSYTGCPSSSTTAPGNYSVTNYLSVGNQSNYHYGYARVASLPGAMTLGAQTLNVTIPGTTCMVVNDILALFPGVAQNSSSGYLNIPLPIPNDPKLANVSYMTQFLFLDKNANQVGITTSRGLVNTIAAKPAGSFTRIYAYSSTPVNPDTQTSGSVGRNYGLMTQLSN